MVTAEHRRYITSCVSPRCRGGCIGHTVRPDRAERPPASARQPDAEHYARVAAEGRAEDAAIAAAAMLDAARAAGTDDDAALRRWAMVDARAARMAARGILPCPRCGRADFRKAAGRQWHLDNAPSCATYARPERHAYIGRTAGGDLT